MLDHVAKIPLEKLLEPWAMLRPVQFGSVEYLELSESVAQHGLLNSIAVRPHPRREGYYEIIDGMWRFSVHKDLHLPDILCIVKYGVTDEDVLALQIQANAVSFETKPIEFAEQMKRLMDIHSEIGAPLTLKELAGIVKKSTTWVSQRLKLLELCDEVKEVFNRGEISLAHAVALAKMKRPDWQQHFLEEAKSITARELEIRVGSHIARSIDEYHERSVKDNYRDYDLRPRLQSMDTLLMELDSMSEISQIIIKKALTTPLQGAKAMLEWVLNLHDAGRQRQMVEKRFLLTHGQRREIIGRQQYEELAMIRELREESER